MHAYIIYLATSIKRCTENDEKASAIVATSVTYCFLLRDHMNGFVLWTMLFVSMLLLVCGLAVDLGGAMLLAGFNTMTREERARYNIKEIASLWA